MLRFASLGSGSEGNATVVSYGDTHILIDCGFSVREATRRLWRLGLTLEQLDAVLVTHEHSDHIKGVPALARKLNVPVFMTAGTLHSRDYGVIPKLHLVRSGVALRVADVEITPVAVPHDAREPVQYVFQAAGRRLGVLTDLGSVTRHVLGCYEGCDALLVEANHDRTMLAWGTYPPSLKARVSGPWGHLSNEQAVELLQQLDTSRLQHLVIGHISQKNNTLELARRAMDSISKPLGRVYYACQQEGFSWLELT